MENPERVTYFAATDARGKRVPFGIKARDRARHMYVIGKTGMGKSTLLENMAIQDIRNGEGMAFIDPHGSAVEKLLDFIPPERVNDVVYFAPFDMEHPIAFNVMEDVGYDKRHLVVSGLMATFKKIWVDAWSARMEYILSNTILALLEYPGATLLDVNRMYTDKNYRKKVVDNVKDPMVKSFWVDEFANFGDNYTKEATPAIQNKIGQFTSNPLIRNIIGQPKSSFDVRDLMDRRKILIINLSKGLVGDTNMKLLGSMLTTRIFLGAMSRANLPPHELAKAPNFYFYVDEFQNFANDTFSEILSEARKYHLNLLIAHQYVAQMEEAVQAAVFGNVGTSITFRVGPLDAELLEKVFTPEFTQEDLVNLGFAQIYLSLMINGIGSRPFSAVTIPPIEAPSRSYRNEVIAASRAQFGVARAQIEEKIFSEIQQAAEEAALAHKAASAAGQNRSQQQGPQRNGKSAFLKRDVPPPRADVRPEPREQERESRREERPAREPRQETPREPRREQAPENRAEHSRERSPQRREDRSSRAPQQREQAPRERAVPTPEKPAPADLKALLRQTIAQVEQKPVAPVSTPFSAPKPAPQPAPVQKPHSEPRVPAPEPRQSEGAGPTPYEVPEETLRRLFKDS